MASDNVEATTGAPLNPTLEESKTFDAAHDGMKQGWAGTFDQLAAYLEKTQAEGI